MNDVSFKSGPIALYMLPWSSGLRRGPFKAEVGVRFPLGVPYVLFF